MWSLQTLEVARSIYAKGSENSHRLLLAKVYSRLGDALMEMGSFVGRLHEQILQCFSACIFSLADDFPGAEQEFTKALVIRQELLPAHDSLIASSHCDLAIALLNQQKSEDALGKYLLSRY